MTDYSGNVVHCAAVRGHIGILAIKSLSSLTTDLVDVTDDKKLPSSLDLESHDLECQNKP
jgi:hypothetical protein